VFDTNTPFGHCVQYQHAVRSLCSIQKRCSGTVFDTKTPFGHCVRCQQAFRALCSIQASRSVPVFDKNTPSEHVFDTHTVRFIAPNIL
jgi:hypothetical protein